MAATIAWRSDSAQPPVAVGLGAAGTQYDQWGEVSSGFNDLLVGRAAL